MILNHVNLFKSRLIIKLQKHQKDYDSAQTQDKIDHILTQSFDGG